MDRPSDAFCEQYKNMISQYGGGPVFFTFPDDVRWNADHESVEFGVGVGEYRGVARISRRAFQRLLSERPTPERCIESYYLQRTRFEGVAERKIRQRQLTEDGNIEITGRDLQEGVTAAAGGASKWRR
jgi:Protein of unknown function (DUF1488)